MDAKVPGQWWGALVAAVRRSQSTRRGALGIVTLGSAVALALMPGGGAWGATTIDGPIGLGAAAPFGVLGASEVTNTGPSVIEGDVGLSPGTSLVGFPPGTLSGGGAFHATDAVADQAQLDLDAAMVTAASLTPTLSGLGNLTGLSLAPGVYSGGELSVDAGGILTLAGSATSVWVFTAASTLVTGSASAIVLTGGASACNVFWRVGSSATLGTDSDFAGTVMAEDSITATTGTDVVGRLLAAGAAVTLDTTDVTVPTGCAPPGSVTTDDAPVITSVPASGGTAGQPYSSTVTATGTPAATYAVTSGALPLGLALDTLTGAITGTPVDAGTSTFTVTATNGVGSASIVVTLTIAAAVSAAELPPTGASTLALAPSLAVVATGIVLLLARRRRRHVAPVARRR